MTYVRLKFVLVLHATRCYPVSRHFGGPSSGLGDVMQRSQVFARAVAEMFGRVGNEQIAEVGILPISPLPVFDLADIDTMEVVVVWASQEAEVAGLEDTVDNVVPGKQGRSRLVLEVVAPDLGVTPVRIQDRRIVARELPAIRLALPELGGRSASYRVESRC